MKVLHVVPYYPPERLGGVGEYAARLHRALREAGHDSHVLTRGRSAEPGVECVARTRLGWFLRSALWSRRALGHDVVHVHGGEALPLLLTLAARRRRPRILATFHVSYAGVASSLRPYTLEGRRFPGGPVLERTLLAWAHRAADALAQRVVDAVVPISRACAHEVLGPRRAAGARVISHGLPALPPASLPALPRVELLYVGRPGARKRVQALPFVLAHVRAIVPGARLRIVGFEWAAEPGLRDAFAERELLEAVECTGPLPSRELPAYYRSADVLVVPSAYEGLPLVIVEAMQCGLPVVATRVSGHPEAVEDGATGFLAPLDDPRALAARCIELLRDPQRREAMSRAARVSAKRFEMARHLGDYLALYAELAETAPGRSVGS
jgi:glycosyltransferase involved in cell wall biosynthesis